MTTGREKTYAKIEARLNPFGKTLNTLRIKTEQRQDKFNGQMKQTLGDIEKQHKKLAKGCKPCHPLRMPTGPPPEPMSANTSMISTPACVGRRLIINRRHRVPTAHPCQYPVAAQRERVKSVDFPVDLAT